MKKTLKKLCAIFLSLSIVLTAIPVIQTVSAAQVDTASISTPVLEVKEAYIIGELEEKREENVKHFRMSDGSYKAVKYAIPVHFTNNGQWVEYDNTLYEVDSDDKERSSNNKDLTTKLSDYTVKLSKKTNGHKFVRLEKGEYKLSWYYHNAEKITAEIVERKEDNDETTVEKVTSEVLYTEVYHDIDFQYIISSIGVKENIILKSADTNTDFTAEYSANGLTAKQKDEKTIELVAKDGEVIYSISAPYMTDDNGEVSQNVTITVFEEKNNTFCVNIKLDEEWLKEETRKFPVTVDPLVKTKQSVEESFSAFVGSEYPDRNYLSYAAANGGQDSASLYVGNISGYGQTESYIKFRTLPNLTTADTVIKAVLYTYLCDCDLGLRVDVKGVTSNWDCDTVTWSNKPTTNDFIADYAILNDGDGNEFISFDITELVQSWHTGDIVNNGISLSTQKTSASKAWFMNTDFNQIAARPILYIEYRNMSGLENYWSYSSQDMGESGAGYVNLYNGNLTYVHNLATYNSAITGFSVSLVYNSRSALSGNGLVSGWNFNISQRIESAPQGLDESVKYVYTDGDGTKHYFVEYEGKIIDEDGLGLEYESQTGTYAHKLKDKNNNSLLFDSSGYLICIKDSYNNAININYTTQNGEKYITSVTTSSGGSVTIQYNSQNQPVSVIDNAGKITAIGINSNGYITTITHPGNQVTTLSYANTKLSEVITVSGQKIKYTYSQGRTYGSNATDEEIAACNATKRVVAVNNYSSNGQEGQTVNYSYSYNQTCVSDLSGHSYTYQFDTYGRTTGIYDQDGNICTQEYTEALGGNIKLNNKISVSSEQVNHVNNHIINGGFTKDIDGWNKYFGDTSSTQIEIDNTQGLVTPKSIRITTSSTTSPNNIQQILPSVYKGKTYTISAYIKTQDVVAAGSLGAGIEIVTMKGSVKTWYYSDMLTGTTDTEIENGFVKVSKTVELASDEYIWYITAGIYYASGTVWVDSVQLEEGDTASSVNLVSNSGFEYDASGTSTPSKYSKSGTVSVSIAEYKEGSKSCRITGSPTSDSYISQVFNISGKAGDTYSFGAWVKANAVPSHETDGTNGLKMELHFTYSDGTNDTRTINYNYTIRDWQYGSKVVIAKKDYTSIQLNLCYYKNCSYAYYDGVFLYKNTANCYTYDKNGNVISSKEKDDTENTYEYNDNHLSKIINPDGTEFEYGYNVAGAATITRSNNSVEYVTSYDSNGNAVSMQAAYAYDTVKIKTGTTYYLRLKASGKYMTVSGNIASGQDLVFSDYSAAANQRFRLIKLEDGKYNIVLESNENIMVDVYDSQNNNGTKLTTYTSNGGENQKFYISLAEDGGYIIVPSCSADGKPVGGNASASGTVQLKEKQSEYTPEQIWYFEPTHYTTLVPDDESIIRLYSASNGKYLTATNTSLVQEYSSIGSASQRFYIEKFNAAGYYTISPLSATNTYLCVSQNNVAFSNSATGDSVLWKITNQDDYWLISPKSDETKVLSIAEGVDIVLKDITNTRSDGFVPQFETFAIKSSATYQDNGNFIHTVTDENGGVTTYNYDFNNGELDSVVDANGNITSYSYASDTGRLTSVNTNSSTVGYAYNNAGYLTNITSPSGTTYGFTYDTFGRSVATTVGNRTLGTTVYRDNKSSLVSSFNYGTNSGTKSYVYDSRDRVVSESFNNQVLAEYKYNHQDRLINKTDKLFDFKTIFSYDIIGRINSISTTEGLRASYVYDDSSRLSKEKFSIEDMSLNVSYTYGTGADAGRLIYIRQDGTTPYLRYSYDKLGRVAYRYVYNNGADRTEYTYYDNNVGTTSLVKEVINSKTGTLSYTYDGLGNITSVSNDGTLKESYTYDALNQLSSTTRGSDVFTYTYDNGGNILSVNKNGTAIKSYTYGDSSWKDLLTNYNGTNITYDELGNPLNWRNNMSFTWQRARLLTSVNDNISYSYDSDGNRKTKTVNGTETEYYYLNGTLRAQKTGNTYILFMYDENGAVYGLKVYENGTPTYYHFIFNLQGDVIGILDGNSRLVVNYEYDEWGNILSITDARGNAITDANHIANLNPIRYRGYYYDTETGFYYLQSRYYDPQVGRFINADSVIARTSNSTQGYNMFAYCFNNPVNLSDLTGCWPSIIKDIADGIKEVFENIFTVKYDVPLYNQGDYNLCWAYSQIMVEDYNSGIVRTKEEAHKRAREIAIYANGKENWNRGNWPTNASNVFGEFGKEPPTLFQIFLDLKNKGPIYAYYGGSDGAHLVVITGVSLSKKIIYTNNPWEIYGKQTYNDFINGFADMPEDWDMPFGFVIYPDL